MRWVYFFERMVVRYLFAAKRKLSALRFLVVVRMFSVKMMLKWVKINVLCCIIFFFCYLLVKLVVWVVYFDVRLVTEIWLNARLCLFFYWRRIFFLCVNWKV